MLTSPMSHLCAWYLCPELSCILNLQHWVGYQNLYIYFNINSAFPDVQTTHAMWNNATPAPSEILAFELYYWLITSQMVPLLFILEGAVSMISKMNYKFWFIIPQDSIPLLLNELELTEGCSICGCSDELVYRL